MTVPFETSRLANIALKSLDPDPELKPDQLNKVLSVQGNDLCATFSAVTDRTLRVGVNSFFDNLNLVVECMDQLDTVKG